MERKCQSKVPGWWPGTGGCPNLSTSVQQAGFYDPNTLWQMESQVSSIVNEKNYH